MLIPPRASRSSHLAHSNRATTLKFRNEGDPPLKSSLKSLQTSLPFKETQDMNEEKDVEEDFQSGYFKSSVFLVNICFLPISIGVKIDTTSFYRRLLTPAVGSLLSFQKIHPQAGVCTDRDLVITWTCLKGKHAGKGRN